jgi:rubredoxin
MGLAFSDFRGSSPVQTNIIWQFQDSLFPFKCDVCRRDFDKGGPRYIGSSLTNHSHRASACQCPDCRAGKNPFKVKAPKLTDRRTSLD